MDRIFRVLLKIFAKRNDVVVDRSGVGEGVVAPDDLKDFFAADDLSCFGNQQPEQLTFPFGDALRLARMGDNFKGVKIDGATAVKIERLEHLRGIVVLRAKKPLNP